MVEITRRELRQARRLAMRMFNLHGQNIFLKFPKVQRVSHQLLIIFTTILAFTGLIQRYKENIISNYIIHRLLGGLAIVQVVHHVAAIGLCLLAIYYLGQFLKQIFINQVPIDLSIHKKDWQNLKNQILFNLGREQVKPRYGKFSIQEKINFWMTVWFITVLILTGLILLFPVFMSSLLEASGIAIARSIHSWEAVSLVLFTSIWHLYHVRVKTKNASISTGYLSEKEMLENYPEDLEKILKAVEFLSNAGTINRSNSQQKKEENNQD